MLGLGWRMPGLLRLEGLLGLWEFHSRITRLPSCCFQAEGRDRARFAASQPPSWNGREHTRIRALVITHHTVGRLFSPQRSSGHCYMFLISFHCCSGTCSDNFCKAVALPADSFYNSFAGCRFLCFTSLSRTRHRTAGIMWAIIKIGRESCDLWSPCLLGETWVHTDTSATAVLKHGHIVQRPQCEKVLFTASFKYSWDSACSLCTQLSAFLYTNTFHLLLEQTIFHRASLLKGQLSHNPWNKFFKSHPACLCSVKSVQ